MRIGPVDTSISALIHLAILVVCLIALPSLYLSKWTTVRESWCAGPVNDALARVADKEGALEKGIGYARTLVSIAPERVPVRMALACLLAKAQQYKEAREVFEKAAALPAATPEEKSQALTGAACSAALDGGIEHLPSNVGQCEKVLISALAAKETADALAAFALAESWKPDADEGYLASRIDKALNAPDAPAPGLLEELYFLQGVIAAHKHALTDANVAFDRVHAINPGNTRTDEFQNQIVLAGLTDPALPSAQRRELLARAPTMLAKLGKNRNEGYFSIALAWLALSGEPKEPGSDPILKADEAFSTIINGDPHARRAFEGRVKLKEMKLAEYVKDVNVPVNGLTGEESEPGSWKKQYTSIAAVTPEKTRIGELLRKIETELYGIDVLWKEYLDKGQPPDEERAAVLLRRIALRRQIAWLSPRDIRKARLKDANDMALALEAVDHSGAAEYVQGLIAIDLDDYAKALKLLQISSKAGYKAPQLDKLLAALERPPTYKDFGPRPNERSFGSNPLVRAILDTPLAIGGLHGQTLNLKGKPVKATVTAGTQLYYVPTSADLTGGPNTFRASVIDSANETLEFPEFHLRIDRDPPDWSVEPPAGIVSNTQTWTITVSDASGIDWHSLRAGLHSGKGAASALDIVVVKDGRYARTLPAANIKLGDPVIRSPFTIGLQSPLSPGEYQVFIEVFDTAGNKLKDQKPYTVK